jgi:hypothetical protein
MNNFDGALILYLVGIVVSLYGFGLFLWWWKKVGSATDVYIFMAFLFGANAFSDAIAAYSRYLRLNCQDDFVDFSTSCWWFIRRVPEIIVLIIFVSRMTWRIYDAKSRESRGEVLIGQNHVLGTTRKEKEAEKQH